MASAMSDRRRAGGTSTSTQQAQPPTWMVSTATAGPESSASFSLGDADMYGGNSGGFDDGGSAMDDTMTMSTAVDEPSQQQQQQQQQQQAQFGALSGGSQATNKAMRAAARRKRQAARDAKAATDRAVRNMQVLQLGQRLAAIINRRPWISLAVFSIITLLMGFNYYMYTHLRPCESVTQILNKFWGMYVCEGSGSASSTVFKVMTTVGLILAIVSGLAMLSTVGVLVEQYQERRAVAEAEAAEQAAEQAAAEADAEAGGDMSSDNDNDDEMLQGGNGAYSTRGGRPFAARQMPLQMPTTRYSSMQQTVPLRGRSGGNGRLMSGSGVSAAEGPTTAPRIQLAPPAPGAGQYMQQQQQQQQPLMTLNTQDVPGIRNQALMESLPYRPENISLPTANTTTASTAPA